MLQQEGHSIAYVSKALGPRNQLLSTYEKECVAILLVVEHWRAYLQHNEFVIKTDQRSLTHLDDQRLTTPWQHKALTKLMGLSYKICYKKGIENRVVDALSRVSNNPSQGLLAIYTLQPVWLQELVDAYSTDPMTTNILSTLAVNNPSGHFSLQQGIIKYKGKIWVGNIKSIQNKILQSLHASPIRGHSGFPVTYKRIKTLFAQPSMKSIIHHFVSHCSTCQQAKHERVSILVSFNLCLSQNMLGK